MQMRALISPTYIYLITISLILALANTVAHCADIATVIKLNTVLRDKPSEDGEKVLLLKKKARLALIDREDTDGWLNVIHIKSSTNRMILVKLRFVIFISSGFFKISN